MKFKKTEMDVMIHAYNSTQEVEGLSPAKEIS